MTSLREPHPSDRVSRPGRVRAGDADRERVATLLAEHYAQGRLDLGEFDERSSRAIAAVYRDELDGLLDDLPGAPPPWQPAPRAGRPSARRPTRPRSGLPLIMLVLALVVLTRGAALWLLPLLWWLGGAAIVRHRPWRGGPVLFSAPPPAWSAAPPCRRPSVRADRPWTSDEVGVH